MMATRGRGGGRGRGRGRSTNGKELAKSVTAAVPHIDRAVVEEALKANAGDKTKAWREVIAMDEEAFVREHLPAAPSEHPHPAFELKEVEGDLFQAPEAAALGHCVSEDLSMSKGIAVGFKERFAGVPELKGQGVRAGGVAFLRFQDRRYIYYLVTKQRYWHKPSYLNLWGSLLRLRELCLEHGVTELALPVIGCGLDMLRWPTVRLMLHRVFEETPLSITIYHWPPSSPSTPSSSSSSAPVNTP